MHASIYNGRRAFIRFQWRSFTDHRSLRLASRSLREIVPPDVTNNVSFVPPRKITSIGAREIASLPLSFVAFRLSSHTHAHTRTRTHTRRDSLSLSSRRKLGILLLAHRKFQIHESKNNFDVKSSETRRDEGVLFLGHPRSPTIRIEDIYMYIDRRIYTDIYPRYTENSYAGHYIHARVCYTYLHSRYMDN